MPGALNRGEGLRQKHVLHLESTQPAAGWSLEEGREEGRKEEREQAL